MRCTIPKRANPNGKLITKTLITCPDCDLLLKAAALDVGSKGHCPRCGCYLLHPRPYSVESTLALSLAGLILFVPANYLPMLSIRLFSNTSDDNLWTGVKTLLKDEMWLVGILVFLASVVFPLLNLLLAFLISLHLYLNKISFYLVYLLRWYQYLIEWAMLEVYALGIIVACVKLSGMSELHFGLGLYAFIALLIINTLLIQNLDSHLFWQKLQQAHFPHH